MIEFRIFGPVSALSLQPVAVVEHSNYPLEPEGRSAFPSSSTMVGLAPRRKPSRKGSFADVPKHLLDEIQSLENQFIVGQDLLKKITNHFVKELGKGLSKEGGNIPMNVTWVMGYPTGDEQGTFLALDMGGTNLRVCEIILPEEHGEFDIIQSKYRLPEELKTGEAEELWDYTADCLQQFIEYHHEDEELGQLPLGFTFSYPATQEYIDHGVLQRWTKGFDIAGVEGKDVVVPFEEALAKRVCFLYIVCLSFQD